MEFDKEKVKFKIAISKIKEENDVVMENKLNKIFKAISIATTGIILSAGAVFAGTKVYENIWKEPEKISNITTEIVEEVKKENITEEEAKELAVSKLKEIGFNANIISTNHYKPIASDMIMYRFNTEDNYSISFNGQTGEFFEIWNENKNIQDINIYITEDEAKDIAEKYYNLFGLNKEEYEITNVSSINNEGINHGSGFTMTVTYNKKYGDVYNPYERITIGIHAKNKQLGYLRVENTPFDNNELVISEDEAIKIALKEDENVSKYKVESTKAKLMIVQMNADSYDRKNNTQKHYEAMQTEDYPMEERNYYKVDDRVRRAWVVVLNYEDNFDGDIVKRYTEGKYSYFVDATTGEIIGGATMDYIYSDSVNY